MCRNAPLFHSLAALRGFRRRWRSTPVARTQYYWQMRAGNGNGTGADGGSWWSSRTLTQRPGGPSKASRCLQGVLNGALSARPTNAATAVA